MDGIHDFGGKQGYGPIDVGETEEPFHYLWEARLFGITRAYTKPVPVTLDWFRFTRETIEPTEYLNRRYYDQWLEAHVVMAIFGGAFTIEEVASGKSARPIKVLSPPMTPDRVDALTRVMTRYDRPSDAKPAFTHGDEVSAKLHGSIWHTRLPQYVRGRRGQVEAFRGFHILPDTKMAGGEAAEALYCVSFRTADLWPEAGAGLTACISICGRAILSASEAGLLPREPLDGAPTFTVPWHAEVLGIANVLMQSGMYMATEWATTLGAEMRPLTEAGEPDTDETYYRAVLAALEHLVAEKSPSTGGSLVERVGAWRRAYLNTPHGQPVMLEAADGPALDHHDHHEHEHDHHHHDH